jgi:DNA-binding transcriptional regulator PaaX
MRSQPSRPRSKTAAVGENLFLLPLIQLRLLHGARHQFVSQDSLARVLATDNYQLRFSELRGILSSLVRKGWISRSRTGGELVYHTSVRGTKALREGGKRLAILARALNNDSRPGG